MRSQRSEAELSKIFRIDSRVYFRVFEDGRALAEFAFGVEIMRLDDESGPLEFSGVASCLFLLLNGSRTAEQAVRDCRKLLNIRSPNFQEEAYSFFDELTEGGYLRVVVRPKPDNRIQRYESLLARVNQSQRKRSNEKTRRRPIRRFTALESKRVTKAERKFSRILNGLGRIQMARYSPSLGRPEMHCLIADLTWKTKDKKYHVETFGIGSAFDIESAATSAIAEAIERRFISFESSVLTSSFAQLVRSGKKALDPTAIKYFDRTQEIVKTGDIVNPGRETKLIWTRYEDALAKGGEIWIPHTPFNGSNGYAVGPDGAWAKFSAVCEIIERDRILFYWRTRNAPKVIDLERAGPRAERVAGALGPLFRRVRFFLLENEFSPLTVLAVLRGVAARGEPLFTLGVGTKTNIFDALDKAVGELIAELGHIQRIKASGKKIMYSPRFDETVWDFVDRADLYARTPLPEAYDFLFDKNTETIHVTDVNEKLSGHHAADLAKVVTEFRKARYHLYFKNCTPHLLSSRGLKVYKAFSPELIPLDGIHRFRALGCPRYFRLTKTLRLSNQPSAAEDLSPWPHPLP